MDSRHAIKVSIVAQQRGDATPLHMSQSKQIFKVERRVDGVEVEGAKNDALILNLEAGIAKE